MKKIIFALLAVLATTQNACAKDGQDGNGGNSSTYQSGMNNADFEIELRKTVDLAPLILNRVFSEYKYTALFYENNNQPLFKKLFERNPEIREIAKSNSLTYKFQAGPCLESINGITEEKDASAFGRGLNGEICLSVSRLKLVAKSSDWKERVFALIAHEMSHLANATEDEARHFQASIEYHLSMDGIEALGNYDTQVLRQLLEARKVAVTTLASSFSTDRFCSNFGEQAEKIDSLAGIIKLYAVFNPKDGERIKAIGYKFMQIFSACGKYLELPNEKEQGIKIKLGFSKVMGSHSELTHSEFLKAGKAPPWMVVAASSDIKFRKISDVDIDSVIVDLELSDIQVIIEDLFARYHASHWLKF